MKGRRAAIWLAIILLFLLVDFRPQREYFRSLGDVYLYQEYAQQLFERPPQLPREYPPLSAVIFAVPQLLFPQQYVLGFALMLALVSWLVVVLVDGAGGRGGRLLLYLLVAGSGMLFFRYDGVVVLLTVGAFLLARRGQWSWAQVLLALGVALKLYPVLLMPIVALWAWQTNRRAAIWSSLVGGVVVLTTFGLMWRVAPEQLQTMVQYHSARPLQSEAIGATFAALIGPVGSEWSFGSVNITAAAAPAIAQVLTIANVAVILAVYASFALRRLAPAAACALVLLLAIATSKVFSTQYVLWVLPFVVLAGERRLLWLPISVATMLVYPVAFLYLVPDIGAPVLPWWFALIVGIRNALWLVACGVGVWDWLIRVPERRGSVVGSQVYVSGRS